VITPASPKDFPWKRSRFGFAVFFFFSLLVGGSGLRLILYLRFGSTGPVSFETFAPVFLVGFHQDFLVALLMTLPLLLWFLVVSDQMFGKLWQRILVIWFCFSFWVAQIFLWFTEYHFFRTYKARFNTLAVEDLAHPRELAAGIPDSFPLTGVLLICATLSLGWVVVAFRYFHQMWIQPSSRGSRLLHFVVALVICLLVLKTVDLSEPRASHDRVLNEISRNGLLALVAAARNRAPAAAAPVPAVDDRLPGSTPEAAPK
jgi:hypothetical protein